MRELSKGLQNEELATLKGLQFSSHAWAKCAFFQDYSPGDVVAVGVSRSENPLIVDDVKLVNQEIIGATCFPKSDPRSILPQANIKSKSQSNQFDQVLIEIQSDDSAIPDKRIERWFKRYHHGSDCYITCVIGSNKTLHRWLNTNAGPVCSLEMLWPTQIPPSFREYDFNEWRSEFESNVKVVDPFQSNQTLGNRVFPESSTTFSI